MGDLLPLVSGQRKKERKVRKGAPTTHITTIIPAYQNRSLKQLLESTLNDPFIETTAEENLHNECWAPSKHSPISCLALSSLYFASFTSQPLGPIVPGLFSFSQGLGEQSPVPRASGQCSWHIQEGNSRVKDQAEGGRSTGFGRRQAQV